MLQMRRLCSILPGSTLTKLQQRPSWSWLTWAFLAALARRATCPGAWGTPGLPARTEGHHGSALHDTRILLGWAAIQPNVFILREEAFGNLTKTMLNCRKDPLQERFISFNMMKPDLSSMSSRSSMSFRRNSRFTSTATTFTARLKTRIRPAFSVWDGATISDLGSCWWKSPLRVRQERGRSGLSTSRLE